MVSGQVIDTTVKKWEKNLDLFSGDSLRIDRRFYVETGVKRDLIETFQATYLIKLRMAVILLLVLPTNLEVGHQSILRPISKDSIVHKMHLIQHVKDGLTIRIEGGQRREQKSKVPFLEIRRLRVIC